MHRAFGPLPAELLLNVLDQLLETSDGYRPVAHRQSDIVTKTLCSLTLVSRSVYPIAAGYLYANCAWLDGPSTFARFCATLGLGHQHQHLTPANHGTVHNYQKLAAHGLSRYVRSVYISPIQTAQPCEGDETPSTGLPTIISLCNNLGSNLKKLHLNLSPIVVMWDHEERKGSPIMHQNMLLPMLCLEELIINYEIIFYLLHPPPNLKRLAISAYIHADLDCSSFLSSPSLEKLVLTRPVTLEASDIDAFFDSYRGKSLDVIYVTINVQHGTPVGTREWETDDTVRIWEADVPLFYKNSREPCDDWLWDHGVAGTLWDKTQRRMTSWAEIQRRLAGPVHLILENTDLPGQVGEVNFQ
jgi:hypothetical protein